MRAREGKARVPPCGARREKNHNKTSWNEIGEIDQKLSSSLPKQNGLSHRCSPEASHSSIASAHSDRNIRFRAANTQNESKICPDKVRQKFVRAHENGYFRSGENKDFFPGPAGATGVGVANFFLYSKYLWMASLSRGYQFFSSIIFFLAWDCQQIPRPMGRHISFNIFTDK